MRGGGGRAARFTRRGTPRDQTYHLRGSRSRAYRELARLSCKLQIVPRITQRHIAQRARFQPAGRSGATRKVWCKASQSSPNKPRSAGANTLADD